jgi:hypothetical protein
MERVGEGRGRRAAVTKTRRMHPRGTSMWGQEEGRQPIATALQRGYVHHRTHIHAHTHFLLASSWSWWHFSFSRWGGRGSVRGWGCYKHWSLAVTRSKLVCFGSVACHLHVFASCTHACRALTLRRNQCCFSAGHWKGTRFGWDHQLCTVPAEPSWGK